MNKFPLWKIWLFFIGAIVIGVILWQSIPVIDKMIPTTTFILMGVINVSLILFPICILALLISHIQDKRNDREAKIIAVSKLAVNERGFSERVISTKTRQLTPSGGFHGEYVINEVPDHYSYENDESNGEGGNSAQLASKILAEARNLLAGKYDPLALPEIATTLALPDRCSMLDVIRKWDLREDNLFLAYGKGNQEIACTLEGFMHVAHDAPTGAGKTSQWKIEESMLLKLGVRVIHVNPHFAPVDKKGNDWRPIARAIEAQGMIEIAPGIKVPGLIYDFDYIANMLKWLALKEVNRRFALQRQGNYSYSPLYLFIDEWPAIVKRHPESAEHQVEILQRGRAVDVCVDTNSQGFLLNDVDLKGSARENFSTAYHMGGSVHSGSKLLDMPVRDINALVKKEQVSLGKGISLLRNNEALPQAELVRLPYGGNDFVYYLFGKADEWMLPEYRTGGQRYEGERESDEETAFASEETEEMEPLQPNKKYYSVSALETMETPMETRQGAATGNVFPFPAKGVVSSVDDRESGIGNDIRETIKRMHRKGMPLREIANLVGLAGRKYATFQQVCREENIIDAIEEA